MKVIIIGNGMVSHNLCDKIRKIAPSTAVELVVYGEEHRPAYDRVHLSDYFNGKTPEDLELAPKSWYKAHGIRLITGSLVTKIDPVRKCIVTHNGIIDTYDALILATGSYPFIPPLPGIDKAGIFTYRTIEDLQQMEAFSKGAQRAAVIGDGLLGLEAAKAIRDLGLDTHVVEFSDRLMPAQLDDRGAQLLVGELQKMGLTVHTGAQTREIAGTDNVSGLRFADGRTLDCDMVVISAGIRPRDELARQCGLNVGRRGGIVVNDQLQTNIANIYAIGEVALHNETIYGLVAPGYEMASVVAKHLTGDDTARFTGVSTATKLKLVGVDVASFGDATGTHTTSVPIVYENRAAGIYKRINISEDGKKLEGGLLVGDADAYGMLLQVMLQGLALPPDPTELILGKRGNTDAAVGQGIASLPDEAQVCACEGLTKGDICQAIVHDGLTDIGMIKKATKACTGCGGCAPLVTDILKHVLESNGKKVKKTLCEHFAFSRQELYDLIRVHHLKTFDAVLAQFGHGDGCELCKPAVASMLASAWNEPITQHTTIQDTNDRFMANIQKGGSYSVVPRIPAGEITPEKLLVIGQVAKKYSLYTKITGAQRIDLFGAQLHELPAIWKELIDAGFESGHAYGKALRTVKSCVGSTWCRFGVQDSVGFALEIEHRYKGIRAPHKLKGAVSGCIRECAEAQSKDFGIIATEKGWNLYVCGNGGARPQHAQLLVADIDRQSCIRYIDRFLMFYIKTADPLTRTATWLNKLEGGLTYLYDVVVNDSLGVGVQLELEMQALIDNYQCEWKNAVENPAVKNRFRHFANSDEGDPSLHFETMREQKVPADWT